MTWNDHIPRVAVRLLCGLGIVCASGTVAPTRSQEATGSVLGQVRYLGATPPAFFVPESGSEQHVLVVAPETHGLRNAVVFLEHPEVPGSPRDLPPAILHQRGWLFRPPVLAVREGQPVRFTSEDPANHNVRSTDRVPANRFSAYTGDGDAYTHRFEALGGRPIEIICDIHAWMTAWLYVFDHPYFTVTDSQGRFRLDGVPTGSHRLIVQQPAGGLVREVGTRIDAGNPTRVEISFDTVDLRLP